MKTPTRQMQNGLILAFGFSISVNLLFLVAPIYMLQVYDRVLTSGSESTLFSLSIIACFLLMIFAFAEGGRKRAIAKVGYLFNLIWAERFSRDALSAQGGGISKKVNAADISKIGNFLQSGSILPLLDLPFSPFFFLTLFLLHPVIGIFGLFGVIVLAIFAVIGERATSPRMINDQKSEAELQGELSTTIERSNSIIALGMRERVLSRWLIRKKEAGEEKVKTLTIAGFASGGSKSLRQILQTLVLGLGAYMVLKQEMSPGAMIAGSIIIGRALAPIDQIIGNWRSISLAKDAWSKVKAIDYQDQENLFHEAITSPKPESGLKVLRLAITVPATDEVLVAPFSFQFEPGQIYALIGDSGSGKSTFLKTLVGALPVRTGEVILGERNLHQWPETDRGQHIGYLPQSIELLPGTIADNICRFSEVNETELHKWCENVGALSVISKLPRAFSMVVNPKAMTLSAGQQQIIGLARAWYGAPPLLILDEPTSNLDPDLSLKFLTTMTEAREAGAVIIVATHDPRLILHVDTVLTLSNRELSAISKAEYINAVRARTEQKMRMATK